MGKSHAFGQHYFSCVSSCVLAFTLPLQKTPKWKRSPSSSDIMSLHSNLNSTHFKTELTCITTNISDNTFLPSYFKLKYRQDIHIEPIGNYVAETDIIYSFSLFLSLNPPPPTHSHYTLMALCPALLFWLRRQVTTPFCLLWTNANTNREARWTKCLLRFYCSFPHTLSSLPWLP